jgi:t-SNARE complex subunit (syntaxin)
VRDFARIFKGNEEVYVGKYKELVGETFNNYDTSRKSNSTKSTDFLQVDDSTSIYLKKRDEEINTLVSSIGELASIFKDMQTLVIEQGISVY